MGKFKAVLIILVITLLQINCQYVNLDKLYEPVNSTYMQEVITNINSLLEGYVYLDIAKNPPNEFHDKIDLKEELNKIDTSAQKPFYDFFRDIKRVFAKTKDLHLLASPSFNNLSNYVGLLPITFHIKTDENNNYQLYLKKVEIVPFIYDDETIPEFINKATEQELTVSSINDTDPFEFIQNFGKEYFDLKNKHSRFTAVIKYISQVPLFFMPLNEEELNLKIKLSDNTEKVIPYFFIINNSGLGNNIKAEANNLDWNYSINEFKCRVDEKNKFNVFYQNTFLFTDAKGVKDMMDIIYNCSKLFHENDYKIIGIESRNEGGLGILGIYLEQLLQPKICTNKMLFSMRKNDFLKDHFDTFKKQYLDYKTCKEPESYDKFFMEKPDHYGDIEHNRTIILDEISLDMKLDLHNKRKELLNTKKTKKPTDIIIFTDTHSFSATSIFLKSFKQSGGAIIAGYFGNPKNKVTIRDSGISSSGIEMYDWTVYFQNLYQLQFPIQLTGQEFYDFDYQKENPIPQEYTFIPVDENVDIYEDYSDDIYDKFINASKVIFDKYENKCNINNEFLLLEDNNCINIPNMEHAHGGYACGDNGEWNRTKCQAFYCDIGYYYDTYQKKCIEDLCTKENNDPNPEPKPDDGEGDDKFPVYAIVLIAIGGILFILIVIWLIRRVIKNKKSSENLIDIKQEGLTED